ncbi:MAG TPA: hypothetical protein VKU02_20020 [Gemmataceae bacterium]|nr:hypothetical protein [Gemmataceae bacterium]
MICRWLWSMFAVGIAASPVLAQAEAWRFRWQEGQVLTYRVEHRTKAAEVTRSGTSETTTKLNLTKRWKVLEVDRAGIARLQLSLDALRLETTTPNRDALLFDSAHPEQGDPHLREQLARFVGQPLAVLKVDGQGRVVQVVESKHGPASRFESELPFILTLPPETREPGPSWERAYRITLEPPQGTGEQYQAAQKYTCKAVADGKATIAVTTFLQNMPESLLDRVPLLQMQPEGEVVFDFKEGRLGRADLHIEKELNGHQGEGSSYRFQSTYTEEFIGNR